MKQKILLTIFHLLFVALAFTGLWSYFNYRSPRKIEYASPRRDNSENRVIKKRILQIGADFTRFHPDSMLRPFNGTWPCFRGEHRDNLAGNRTPLAKDWGRDGPRVMWRQ
ncbi:MAG: hypothetical protein PHQ27_07565, partial [Victivallales bacterium]|nr:hypothetical protein [Victivallales bacterium]